MEDARTDVQVKPSFPCEKASSATEHAICDSPELAELDNTLARLYGRRRAAHPDIKRSQLEFLGEMKRCGGVFSCVRELQQQRIAELQALD